MLTGLVKKEESSMTKKAIILFSGGLDSLTCLAIAKSQGYQCYALSFRYGQKHAVEIEQAKKLARSMAVYHHQIMTLSLDQIGGSALTDPRFKVPDYQPSREIPLTYVPGRNTIFLSYALAVGEVNNAYDIFIGVNHVDYSNYPDCRPDYIFAFEQMANLGTKAGVENKLFKVHTPLLFMNKADIIRSGINLGLDYSESVSCYRADTQGRACGKCDSCSFRRQGFETAGIADPTLYYA
jgi:7-cyano-7-deazaguanine synthase